MNEAYKFDPTKYQPTVEDRARLRVNPEALKLSGDGLFFTIQGEGQSIGKPSVFMRLQMCNLECNWPCDTPYTWQKDTPQYWQEPKDRSFQDTAEKLRESWQGKGKPRLVITGGEPMIQQKQISKLLPLIPEFDVEIETNGTIKPIPSLRERVQFNVSPKLENSANALEKRYKPEVLKDFNTLEKTTFKFVVMDRKDIFEIRHIVDECGLDNDKVICMPEGVTVEGLREHARIVEPYVKRNGWRLMGRSQIDWYGSKRAT